jgi:capsular polysaccharide biosynthesis protein
MDGFARCSCVEPNASSTREQPSDSRLNLYLAENRAEPPGVSIPEALRRGWLLVLIPIVLFMGVAAYVGLTRTPQYTAETRLTVGRVDVSPAALATFATATQTLASAYARAAEANAVVNPVAKRFGVPPGAVRGSTKATLVPDSPVIRVSAQGASAREATGLANATADSLVSYTTRLNRSTQDSKRLLRGYAAAALELSRAEARVADLKQEVKDTESSLAKSRLIQAESAQRSATLKSDSLANAYTSSQQGLGSTKLVQKLTEATGASSDRMQVLQLLLFIAAVAGVLVGLALAVLRATRRVRAALLD